MLEIDEQFFSLSMLDPFTSQLLATVVKIITKLGFVIRNLETKLSVKSRFEKLTALEKRVVSGELLKTHSSCKLFNENWFPWKLEPCTRASLYGSRK